MKRRIIARSVLSAGIFLFLAAVLCQAENHETEEGSYKVVLAFDKGKPVVGINHVRITVTDNASNPVLGARVKVSYFMPSLKGRPPMMGNSTRATPSREAYEAVLKLSMKGEWRVIVTVATLTKTEETAFAYVVE